ncbi:hypothetical protein P43SY_011312 [Pythium insidiosum]|uniref:Uncharacterized protein n=1 Tax=Pythium insidiosum TaxID=114742 RepID=A0AAD5Q2M5_PYTIN|nr:hypothetical protein P43SY_011312 [Pythium insidiosum]
MLKMQRAIRGITADVDQLFVRLQREMDALAVFDSAANQLRAQTLCLVELEKRCRLDKIRDDAVREVLAENREGVLKDSASDKDPGRRRGSSRALLQMEGKLKHALGPTGRRDVADSGHQQQQQQRQRAPLHAPRHEPVKRPSPRDKPRAQKRANAKPAASRTAVIAGSTVPSSTATASGGALSASNQSEDSPRAGDADNEGVGDSRHHGADDVLARHPHIAQAIQYLRAAGSTRTLALGLDGAFRGDAADTDRALDHSARPRAHIPSPAGEG